MTKPRVLSLVGDENGCTLWRTWQPFAELQKRGHIAEWDWLDKSPQVFPLVAAGVFNAVVLPRLAWRDHSAARNWFKQLHRAGLATIYEVDDDIFSTQIAARQHATTEPDKSLETLEQDRRDRIAAIRLCDGVTVTSDSLARIVRQYVDVDVPVRVVPNSIDVRWWRSTLRGVRRVVPPLTIGWAGGARYEEDLEPLAEAWHNIAANYPSVTFTVQGFLADVLVRAVPDDRIRRLPWLPLAEYPRALLNVDIACASVADKHFNRCKTPIKLWEYTLAGAVTVVSPTLYGPVASDGEDCLVAETAAEWEVALSRLIEDQALRRRLWREQRRKVVTRYSLEANWRRWPDAWSEIIDAYQSKARRQLLLAS